MKRNTERQMKALVRKTADIKKYKAAMKSGDLSSVIYKKHAQAPKSQHEDIVKWKLKSTEKEVAILTEKLKAAGTDTGKLSGEKTDGN